MNTTQESQAPRPRWVLVRELQKAAHGTSEEFWIWWWSLPKAERLALLDAEVAA